MVHERAPGKAPLQSIGISGNTAGDDSADDSLEEITQGSFLASTQVTAVPTFGRPTQIGSKKHPTSSMFNQNKHRPELHQSTRTNNPNNYNPMYSNRSSNAYKFSRPDSFNPNPPYKKPTPVSQIMFSTKGSDAQAVSYDAKLSTSYTHSNDNYNSLENYMAPKDAEAALKALLEGAMDEDEDDEEGDKPIGDAELSEDQRKDSSSIGVDKEKMKKGPQEDGTLEGINVKLLPHQVEGVKWMKQREIGPVKRGRIPKGGILADDMGLGKTLQSISLIVTNSRPEKGEQGWKKNYENFEKSTLVVAPLALIRQWEAEIKDKVSPNNTLRVCVHHGPQRTKKGSDLVKHDVVITTYQTLVSEYDHSEEREGGHKTGCFGVRWWRVILDEAHSIKNRNAKSTKACYALRSEYRWCLTGTPLQNHLDELQSLIRFLQIAPYDDLQEWRENITKPITGSRGHIALRRLHSLLRCFMKRRKKEVLKEEGALVPGGKKALDKAREEAGEDGLKPEEPMFRTTARNVVPIKVDFSPAERKYYENLEKRADESIEKMMKGGMNYANALVLLLRLRQACNHPKLVGNKLDKDKDVLGDSRKADASEDVDSLADMLGGLGIQSKKCDICMRDLSPKESADEKSICAECHDDLVWFNQNDAGERKKATHSRKKARKGKNEKKKKPQKSKVKKFERTDEDSEDQGVGASGERCRQRNRKNVVVESDDEDDDIEDKPKDKRRHRNRKAVVDSDDEEEEGSWLVPEEERGSLNLGKAGGTDDENAEGGGDTIVSEDSEDDDGSEEGSKLDSFIVNDEDVSRGESIVYSDSEEDDLPSLAKIANEIDKRHGTPKKGRKPNESQGDEEEDDEYDTADEGSETEEDSADDSDASSGEDTGISDSDAEDSLLSPQERPEHVLASAKIRELINILGKECREHKFIVFSQFTSMLDLVEPFLHKAGFGYARYDGAMRNDLREESLNQLRNNKKCRVLLCSLKCGSLGLNLTAATRVVIMEPFWNPFIEEQAIDRVHRLTQKVDVSVYKLTVSDTVEERILDLQEKKRMLAEQTIEGSQKKDFNMGINLNELMALFRSNDVPYSPGRPGEDLAFYAREQSKVLRGNKNKANAGGGRKESQIYGRRW